MIQYVLGAGGWGVGTAVPGVAVPGQAPSPTPGQDRGEEFGKSSPIALVLILLLALALVVLIRSMNKHLRRVPEQFDDPDRPTRPGKDAEGESN